MTWHKRHNRMKIIRFVYTSAAANEGTETGGYRGLAAKASATHLLFIFVPHKWRLAVCVYMMHGRQTRDRCSKKIALIVSFARSLARSLTSHIFYIVLHFIILMSPLPHHHHSFPPSGLVVCAAFSLHSSKNLPAKMMRIYPQNQVKAKVIFMSTLFMISYVRW